MAAIGDVLVKFVADFAEFSKGMDEGVKRLEKFGDAALASNKKIEGFLGQLRGLAIVSAALYAGREIVKWGEETAKAAAEQEKLAKALGFTADEIEAMQKNAKATGTTFNEQVAYFKNHRSELEQMTNRFRDQGELMKGPLRAAFADINHEMEVFGRTIGVVRNQFQGGMVDTVASKIAAMIRDMAASLAYFEVHKGSISSVRELMAIFTGAGGLVGFGAAERAQQQIDALKATAVEAEVAYQ